MNRESESMKRSSHVTNSFLFSSVKQKKRIQVYVVVKEISNKLNIFSPYFTGPALKTNFPFKILPL